MAGLGAARADVTALLGPGDLRRLLRGARGDAATRSTAALPGSAVRTRRGTPGLDLRAGLRRRLRGAGVARVGHDPRCTVEDPDLYSHRRDGRPGRTGRLAAVTWLDPSPG